MRYQVAMRILLVAMVIAVSSSNYLVQFPINHWLTFGSFTYPVTFLVSEICNRRYGARNARKVVYAGFAVAVIISTYLSTARIAFASVSAFLVAQLLDISIFNRLRQKKWWIAPISASIFASLIDSFIFFELAFLGEDLPVHSLMFGDFLVKLALDLFMLLPYRFVLNGRSQRNLQPINSSGERAFSA